MKNGRTAMTVRSGNIEFLRVNAVVWRWRDMYHWLLSLSWPRFSLFLLTCYLGVNVLFAALYVSVPGGVAELAEHSYANAFFFSVETLATVGYGHMYPVSVAAHLIATTEIVVGMFGMAVTTGLIFVRFSRPTANLLFSRNLVLSNFDGQPALMMRVANQRHQAVVEAEFRIMMIRTTQTEEGELMARFHELKLQVEGIIIFPAAMTIRHLIDESSPLHGMTAAEFERDSVRFMASVACVDVVVPAAVHSQASYTWREVKFGERFVEIYTEAPGDGRWVVDYGRLHETEPAPVGK
ncbi:MAG: Inward rectifier potassium channel [Akkermansiaceae bacterium]|nr:Inward rectifier potassium channel [Akkermansiaceae bacterium]